ncbi:hypothetical protein ACWD0G_32995, partial [Streptomyces goshikiensis]
DALVTQAVVLVDEPELLRRNATREHPVPEPVLAAQLHRFSPPYPGQGGRAHRTWYIGAGGTVEDTAGGIRGGAGTATGTGTETGMGTGTGTADAHQ